MPQYFSPPVNPGKNTQDDPLGRPDTQTLQQKRNIAVTIRRNPEEYIDPSGWTPSNPATPQAAPPKKMVTVVPGPGYKRALGSGGTWISEPTKVALDHWVTRRLKDGSLQLFREMPEEPKVEENKEDEAPAAKQKPTTGPSHMGPGTVVDTGGTVMGSSASSNSKSGK